jgi:two-component system, chemotaxis family, sensor kinase CheA
MVDITKYNKLFLNEADEQIATLNTTLLGLEKNPNNLKLANYGMRAAHTLKSSSAAMEHMEISHLAHAMEELFENVRTKKHELSTYSINTLFNCVDALGESIRLIKLGKDELNMQKLKDDLQKGVSGDMPTQKVQPTEKVAPTSLDPIESIKVDVTTIDKLMNLTEELLVERLRFNEFVRIMEDDKTTQDEEKEQSLFKKNITKSLTDDKNEETNISTKSPLNFYQINGELLKTINESFNRLVSELQYNVSQARLVPLGQIFERFPRMVRDMAHSEEKDITFISEDGDIELDRTVIERIGEPLVHLIRNAVDHGIEKKGSIRLVARRLQASVSISVENDSSVMNWEKIIHSAMEKKIISHEKGMELLNMELSENRQEENISENSSSSKYGTGKALSPDLEKLLFHPQLSTKSKVTETSGRGIGLYIVKSAIDLLGGTVVVESPIDSKGGTRFILELPLTLAIIQAMLVKVSHTTFALPFSQIDRTVRISRKNIKKVFDQEVAVIEQEDIPIIRLNKFFGNKQREGLFFSDEEMGQMDKRLDAELMIITRGENSPLAGIIIDEMISEQEIVVKPLTGFLKQTKGIAGITLLGDGKPALILDVGTLL